MTGKRKRTSRPVLGDVLHTLKSAMALLRRCRVNPALTIQLFSQVFHFINMWLFNRVVLEPQLRLCTRAWGVKLRQRLERLQTWAESQGLELAAECHLARISQVCENFSMISLSPVLQLLDCRLTFFTRLHYYCKFQNKTPQQSHHTATN